MLAFRVEKKKYISSLLQGIPGEKFSFRWNTRGNPIIYSSASRSLALHEKSGNISKPFHGLPLSFVLAVIELPDGDYKKILPEDLPSGWDQIGVYHPITQEIGDNFTASDELVLYVPSTIVKGEFNILINPHIAKKLEIKVSIEDINKRLQDQR